MTSIALRRTVSRTETLTAVFLALAITYAIVSRGTPTFAQSTSGLPDLSVERVTFDPVTRRPTITIRNDGAVAASIPGTYVFATAQWFNAAGTVVHTWGLSNIVAFTIAAGASTSISPGPVTMPTDALRIVVAIDEGDRITESNERNNGWEVAVSQAAVAPVPSSSSSRSRFSSRRSSTSSIQAKGNVKSLRKK